MSCCCPTCAIPSCPQPCCSHSCCCQPCCSSCSYPVGGIGPLNCYNSCGCNTCCGNSCGCNTCCGNSCGCNTCCGNSCGSNTCCGNSCGCNSCCCNSCCGNSTSARCLGYTSGAHISCVNQLPPSELCIQPPPFVTVIPGPVISASCEPVRVGGYTACAGCGPCGRICGSTC